MTILFMMIPMTILLVTIFVILFLSAVHSEQFEDLETPAHAMLIEDDVEPSESVNNEDVL